MIYDNPITSQNIYFPGRAILFNTVVSLVFVLRYLMTFLRNMGLAHKLPLDHNIYFHKVVGWIIFVQAWLHTIAHLINFGERFELKGPSLLKSHCLLTNYRHQCPA